MRLFFLKTYLLVIASSIAVLILTIFVIFKPVILETEWVDFQEEIVVDRKLMMMQLDQLTESEWSTAVEDYEPVFDMTVELLSSEDLSKEETQFLKTNKTKPYLNDFDGEVWYGLFPIHGSGKFLKIGEADVPFSELDNDDLLLIFIPLILILAAQALGTIFLIRSISKPLTQLTTATRSFGEGNLAQRAPKLKAPVADLANSFNTMADQLENKIREQQITIGAIPHELRTPLSRTRFALDMCRTKKTKEDLQQQIEQIDGYVDDLDQAVEDVLELARLKAGDTLAFTTFDLKELSESVIEQYHEHDIKITLDAPQDFKAWGNAGLIRRCIHNLLQNAVQHTNETVTLRLSNTDTQTVIKVEDDGPGIPVDKLEEVFLPFSRLDKSRSRQTGGIGLGLALVDLIMQHHEGSVAASNRNPNGLLVELNWPARNT